MYRLLLEEKKSGVIKPSSIDHNKVAVVISYQLQEVRESTLYEVGGEPQKGVESTRRL